MNKKLTKPQHDALVAFASHEGSGWPESVKRTTVWALLRRNLIEVVTSTGLQYQSDYVPNFCGKGYHCRRTAYCITTYALTDAGRAAINA